MKFSKPNQIREFEIHPLIAERYSPRAFDNRELTDDELGSLFEAARWAASSMNEQPWRFIYARKGQEAFDQIVDGLMDGNKPWAREAPVLVITLSKKTFTKDGKVNVAAVHDMGLAVGNLTLQAQSMSIGVHQLGGIIREKLRSLFEIPDDYEIVTALALGYYGLPEQLEEPLKTREMALRTRKSQSEFLFNGTFKREVLK